MTKNQKSIEVLTNIKISSLKIIILFLSVMPFSHAEYRVYQYWVKSKSHDKASLITSTLNPKAYIAYYGNEREISLNLVRSWLCYGDTGGHKRPCRFEETIEEVPASTETSKDKNSNEIK